jgi:uncharacterized membrane protein
MRLLVVATPLPSPDGRPPSRLTAINDSFLIGVEAGLATRIWSSVFINAPVERVFTRVAQHDICNEWLEFVSSASYTSRGKTGVGTSAHHSGRVMGRKMEWDGRIIEWTENNSIVWEAISGTPREMRMKAVNRVVKEGDGACYSLEVEYVLPYSIFGKIMDLIMIRRSIRKSVQRSTQNLKRILEQR